MVQTARQRFTFHDYVELEAESPVKHEFLDGWVWAMAGGSPEHAALAANMVVQLAGQLQGRPCQVFTSDLRIRVKTTGLSTYPDVTVVCGELQLDPDDSKGHTVLNPRVIVEILSPSTEDYDRNEKLEHYQQISSLEEILLIAHDARRVEVWRRQEAGADSLCAGRGGAGGIGGAQGGAKGGRAPNGPPDPKDSWEHSVFVDDDTVHLTSLGCDLPLAEIYRDPLAR